MVRVPPSPSHRLPHALLEAALSLLLACESTRITLCSRKATMVSRSSALTSPCSQIPHVPPLILLP